MKRILKTIAKVLLVIVIVLAVAAGGGYAYLQYTASQSTGSVVSSLQTVKLAAGTIETTISATGSVRTKQTAQVAWQASGKVGAVTVKTGDPVKANTLIASLDASSLPNSIITAQEDLVTAQQALADLQNNKTDLPVAELAVITAQTAVDTAQKTRDNLNYARGTDSQIAAAQAAVLLAQQKVNQMQSAYNATSGSVTTDPRKAQAFSSLADAKTALASSQYNLAWIKGSATAADIAAADTNLALAKAKLADAQAAYDKIKNGPDASSLVSAEQRIAADQAVINSQYIYSPFAGTISSISSMVGDVVSAGTTAFRIDDMTADYIDLAVSEVDIANVQTGQAANISFDAISGKTYTGVVTKVGQVGSTSNSVVNFTVTVQVTDADSAIKPGMTASSEVVVNSVSNVLVVSTKAIKTINNQKYVYILTTANTTSPASSSTGSISTTTATTVQQIVPVKVTAGASNDTQTQITSSQLKEGDLIISNPTSATTTTTTVSSGQAASGLSGLLGGLLGGNVSGGGGPAGGAPSGSPPGGGGTAPSGGSAPASGG